MWLGPHLAWRTVDSAHRPLESGESSARTAQRSARDSGVEYPRREPTLGRPRAPAFRIGSFAWAPAAQVPPGDSAEILVNQGHRTRRVPSVIVIALSLKL